MDTFTITIAFTAANFCLTCISIYCALRSTKETERQTELMHQQTEIANKQAEVAYKQLQETGKQTEIAQKQLEESYKPDYPTTKRLEAIANSIQKLDGTLKDAIKDK